MDVARFLREGATKLEKRCGKVKQTPEKPRGLGVLHRAWVEALTASLAYGYLSKLVSE
jgi:hypothetical protein